jgi:hypothetical protein
MGETIASIATWCDQYWPRYSDADLAQHAVAAVSDLLDRAAGRGFGPRADRRAAVVSIADTVLTIAYLAYRRRVPVAMGQRGLIGTGTISRNLNLASAIAPVLARLDRLAGTMAQGMTAEPVAIAAAWGQLLAMLEYLEVDQAEAISAAMSRRRLIHGGAPTTTSTEGHAAIALVTAARPMLDEVHRQVEDWAASRRGPGRTQRMLPHQLRTTIGAMFDAADALARYDEARAESLSQTNEASQ